MSGVRRCTFEPLVTRDTAFRKLTLDNISTLASKISAIQAGIGVEAGVPDPIISELDKLCATVIDAIPDLNADTLSRQALDALRSFSVGLDKAYNSEHFGFKDAEFPSILSQLITSEEKEHPAKSAQKLLTRLPQFVLFEEEDRDLKSNYDLGAFFNEQKRTPIPRALDNLTTTADLSLESIFRAMQTNDQGKIETTISNANDVLNEKMSAAWNQSEVEVRFRPNGNQLSILVGTKRSGFEIISERSDGLRQFVALFASLSKRIKKGREVILLIDEAEVHLHYDAQADLVQMLAKQEFAKKVVFTTHSIGCLPEDLGSGVRLVQPIDESTSKIVNKFWAEGGVGLSPVLFGMGAATMAFLPIRYCVLTEGPTDMLLLPAMLREVTEKETLGFQISPGLAGAGDNQIAVLQNEGRRVVYLVDGDEGGKAIGKKLKSAGIPEHKILRLDQGTETSCVIEDFVEDTIYVNAINEELARSGQSKLLSPDELPASMRPRMVEKWCANVGISAPNKVNVAYRILEQIYESNLVHPDRREALLSIHRQIIAEFHA